MKRESAILREVELALGAMPGLVVLRNSVGVAMHVDRNGREWKVPYGLGNGSPDLIVLMPPGRVFGIETKAQNGKPSEAQKRCQSAWREQADVRVYVARSVEDALGALAAERSR